MTEAFALGTRLGPYEITGAIGAGGMGEVFRARDTKLGREAAIKVLPAAFAQDAERVARFKREAQILASLTHPNIAGIYGLEEINGTLAIAMEYVDGEDLAQRLARGAVPVDEAIALAKQIADALEEAHEHGIVHRDLKPANVKLTPDGRVKVLDFGLAKALEAEPTGGSGTGSLSHSPTVTSQGTVAGVILGTAAYMSPEQARGKKVDKRADIWAFGVVLFEMLTGQRLFHGETVSDTLAAVLTRAPDWRALPKQTPQRVRRLLERCLEREPTRRLRDIGEARILIAEALSRPDDGPADERQPPPRASQPAFAIAASLLAAVAGGVFVWKLQPPAPQPRVLRLALTLPAGQELRAQARQRLAFSPDGARLVYSANLRLRMRAFDSLESSELPGTEDGHSPFFSPDGEWIGFVAAGNLKKTRVAGGAPVTIAPLETFAASWGRDDTILVGGGYAGILRVPAAGGTPQVVVAPEPGFHYSSPRWLPDGKSFLFTRALPGSGQESSAMLRGVSDGSASVLLSSATQAQYVSSGHIVYSLDGVVLSVAFDIRGRKVLSEPVRLVENAAWSTSAGITYFALSESGTLAYVPAASSDVNPAGLNLVAVTRTGAVSKLPLEARLYSDPRASPDGRSVAVHLQNDKDDVWIADLARGSLARQSFDGGEDETPVWSPDGRAIAWTATRPGVARAVLRRSVGGGNEELVWRSDRHLHLRDYTPDGRTLVFELQTPKGTDVWRLSLGDRPEAVPFLASDYNERSSRLSPDGRWLAYVSDETGRQEVYVQSFPELGNKRPVSTVGGVQPIWARDGKAIFYRAEEAIWEVAFEGGENPRIGSPRKLFADRFESPQAGGHTGWDAFPDGRFLMIQAPDRPRAAAARLAEILLVFNFPEELKAKVPPR